MGKIFTLDPSVVKLASDAFDDLIDQLGKPCKLVYHQNELPCNNCVLINGRSSGHYKTGGPVPFVDGQICPVCDGTGKLSSTAGFSIVTLVVNWKPKNFQNAFGVPLDPNKTRIPGGYITTKGYVTDLPAVLKCDSAIMDVNANYLGNNFRLIGEPATTGNIVKNRYFTAAWERIL